MSKHISITARPVNTDIIITIPIAIGIDCADEVTSLALTQIIAQNSRIIGDECLYKLRNKQFMNDCDQPLEPFRRSMFESIKRKIPNAKYGTMPEILMEYDQDIKLAIIVQEIIE